MHEAEYTRTGLTMSVCDKIHWGPARVRAEADAENPEGRDELKISGGIQISQSAQEEN